jgi:L-alanine-DL-glutamate epimerase-like enolase superfamily enzyme
MKITDVQTYLLAIPIKKDELHASWRWGAFNQVIVAIHTDEGITGYGEAFGYGVPHAVFSVIHRVLKPMLVGADPTDIHSFSNRMARQTHLFGRYGITTFAISGVDIALWDIAGKCAGLPLYRLFGGAPALRVPAYASLTRYPNPERMGVAALYAKKAGFGAVKIHQIDLESLRVAREKIGDGLELMVDINCEWMPEQALHMARQFAPHKLRWLEEPLWPPEDFKNLAQLGNRCGIPIAAGENACTVHQFRQMLEAGAAAYIQPSVIKVGGITEWRKIAALAETYNVAVAPHSPYFGPGFLATAHLVASTLQADSVEYLCLNLEASIFREPIQIKDGFFSLPQGPGIGLEIDEAILKHYSVAP